MNVLARSCLAVGLVVLGLAAVGGCGEVRNPFEKEKPVVSTPVPADFAVVMDESSDTYYSRQDVRQVVTAQDGMSRTLYKTQRDYNNTVANEYTVERVVSREQLQAMWDEVVRNDLMAGAQTWYYWQSFTDDFRRNERRIQIRANGKVVGYKQLNHWGYKLRDLAMQVDGVRVARNTGRAEGVGEAVPMTGTVTMPAGTMPVGTRPAGMRPATEAFELPVIVPEK